MDKFIRLILLFPFFLSILGCYRMSEKFTVRSAGLNGGFEVSRNGLPVNWLLYTPNTVPQAEFEITLDTLIFREGKQSLRFDVKTCSSIGGWQSPGFTNEFSEVGKYLGENTYRIRFWIRNQGTEFWVTGGGVALKGGDMETLVKENLSFGDWQLHEYEVKVSQGRWLRIQLNILQPGVLWIDGVEINRV